jgi:hypothetical protein
MLSAFITTTSKVEGEDLGAAFLGVAFLGTAFGIIGIIGIVYVVQKMRAQA